VSVKRLASEVFSRKSFHRRHLGRQRKAYEWEKFMLLASIGVALNFLGALAIMANLSESSALSGSSAAVVEAAIWLSWGISVLGLILGGLGNKKLGAILVIVGSILFVPMGLVAVFGAGKMRR
jgi:hypothetical protein